MKSYALDVLASRDPSQKESVLSSKVLRFIESAVKSKGESHPSIGFGINITFESRTVFGAALVGSNHILHLLAFLKKRGKILLTFKLLEELFEYIFLSGIDNNLLNSNLTYG